MNRHLRLVAADGKPVGTPPPAPAHPKITTVDGALADMRLCAAVVKAEPADLFRGYTDNEFAAQMAAVDRMVQAFQVLDRLLSQGSRGGGSTSEPPPHPPPHPTKTEGV